MSTFLNDLSPAFTQDEIAASIVTAVRNVSVAVAVTAPQVTTHKALTFPVIDQDLTAVNVAEGAQIQLSDIGTGQVTVTPRKQVAATRLSTEAFADILADSGETALTILTGSLTAGLAARVDANLFDLLGTLTGVTDGGDTDLTDLDAFHAALASVRKVGAVPTSILISPDTALRLSTMRESDTSKRSLLAPTPQDPAVLALAGVPFVESRHCPDGAAYAIARDRLVTVVRQDAAIEVDRSVFAMTREVLVLGECRTASGALHAASVVKLSVVPS